MELIFSFKLYHLILFSVFSFRSLALALSRPSSFISLSLSALSNLLHLLYIYCLYVVCCYCVFVFIFLSCRHCCCFQSPSYLPPPHPFKLSVCDYSRKSFPKRLVFVMTKKGVPVSGTAL